MHDPDPHAKDAASLNYAALYWTDAQRVMGDQRGGYRANTGSDGSSGSGRGVLDEHDNAIPNVTSVEAAVLAPQHDESRTDERRARQLWAQIHPLVVELERLVAKYKPTAPTSHGRDPEVGIDWCISCHRLEAPDGSRRSEPVARRKATGDPYYKGRCLYCGRFGAAHDMDPPLDLLEDHHRGIKANAARVEKAIARARIEAAQRAKRKAKKK